MQFEDTSLRSFAIMSIIMIIGTQTLAQSTWIDQIPGYSLLPECAEVRLSAIVRGQSSGCGQITSYSCFCEQSYTTMNEIIATAVSSACNDMSDVNSALDVFGTYCQSPPATLFSVTATSAPTNGTFLSIRPGPFAIARITHPNLLLYSCFNHDRTVACIDSPTHSDLESKSSYNTGSSDAGMESWKIALAVVFSVVGVLVVSVIWYLKWFRPRQRQAYDRKSAAFDKSVEIWYDLSAAPSLKCQLQCDTGAQKSNWVSQRVLEGVGGKSTPLEEDLSWVAANGGSFSASEKVHLSFRDAGNPRGQVYSADFFIADSKSPFDILLGANDLLKFEIVKPACLGIVFKNRTPSMF